MKQFSPPTDKIKGRLERSLTNERKRILNVGKRDCVKSRVIFESMLTSLSVKYFYAFLKPKNINYEKTFL